MKLHKREVKELKKTTNAKEFERKLKEYFASISKTETAKEKYPTGEISPKGEPIYALRDALSDSGEPIKLQKWFAAPSVSGMCLFLGISKEDLRELCKKEEYSEILSRAELIFESYTEQMLSEGRQTQGLLQRLEKNAVSLAPEGEAEKELGMAERTEILKLLCLGFKEGEL